MTEEDKEVEKVEVPEEYPPEDVNYLRGNDCSPVAVIVILNQPYDNIPERVDEIVRTSVEAGAALAGTLQTENIGTEKKNCKFNPKTQHKTRYPLRNLIQRTPHKRSFHSTHRERDKRTQENHRNRFS